MANCTVANGVFNGEKITESTLILQKKKTQKGKKPWFEVEKALSQVTIYYLENNEYFS